MVNIGLVRSAKWYKSLSFEEVERQSLTTLQLIRLLTLLYNEALLRYSRRRRRPHSNPSDAFPRARCGAQR